MNSSERRRHPVDSLFTVVLLGLFLIFLLVMLLFSAQAFLDANLIPGGVGFITGVPSAAAGPAGAAGAAT